MKNKEGRQSRGTNVHDAEQELKCVKQVAILG